MSTTEDRVSELVTAANQLTTVVDNTIQGIKTKADESIASVESTHAGKASQLTIIATDGYRKAIEGASGGRNTVIYDDQGNPNVMCVIPSFNIEDLGLAALNLGSGLHPAFVTNGAPRSEILVGKYLASNAPGGTAVVGGVQPRASVNYDVAKELCTRKGSNFHLMSIHEWAAISLWSLANGTEPRGNTNYGRSHELKHETARRYDDGLPGDTAGTGRTDTGKGPASWNHDNSEFGISDLTGNVWEWLDQMLLDNGRIATTLDNNPAVDDINWQRHAAYLDAPSDGQSGNIGSPILSNVITNRNGPVDNDSHDFAYMHNANFAAIAKAQGYQPNELLRQLLIESETTTTVKGGIWGRNYGQRFPIRGGNWSAGSLSGLGALDLYNSRVGTHSHLGFRPAFFV